MATKQIDCGVNSKTREMEGQILVERYQRTKDRRILDELIERYQGVSRRIAARYATVGTEYYDDLVIVGLEGIIRTAERFNPKRNVRVLTYLYIWCEHYIRRYNQKNALPIMLPAWIWEWSAVSARVWQELTCQIGREPTDEEMARALAMDIETFRERKLQCLTAYQVNSYDALQVTDNGKRLEKFEMRWETTQRSDAIEIRALRNMDVQKALKALSENEARVIQMLVMEDKTLDEAGKLLKRPVSRERVRQIYRTALSKLQKSLRHYEGEKLCL